MNVEIIAGPRKSKSRPFRGGVARTLAAIPLLLLSPLPALAGSFLLVPMNFVSGQRQSDATDINDAGQVAAQYNDANGIFHGVIWDNGAITHVDLGYASELLHINAQGVAVGAYIASCCQGTWKAYVYNPVTLMTRTIGVHGGYGAFPNGVNASDVVVGDTVSTGNNPTIKGFKDDNTIVSHVNVKTAASTVPVSINDAGVVAGYYIDAAAIYHGFTRSGNKTKTIDVAGASGTLVSNIANDGTVAGGYSDAASHYHGYTENNGVFTLYDYPAATKTYLEATNAGGEAVGYWQDSGGITHGLIAIGGAYYSFDYPGSTYTVILKLNTVGSVVGLYVDRAGIAHGFVGVCTADQAPCTSGHVG